MLFLVLTYSVKLSKLRSCIGANELKVLSLVTNDRVERQFLQQIVRIVVVNLDVRHKHGVVVVFLDVLDSGWVAHTWHLGEVKLRSAKQNASCHEECTICPYDANSWCSVSSALSHVNGLPMKRNNNYQKEKSVKSKANETESERRVDKLEADIYFVRYGLLDLRIGKRQFCFVVFSHFAIFYSFLMFFCLFVFFFLRSEMEKKKSEMEGDWWGCCSAMDLASALWSFHYLFCVEEGFLCSDFQLAKRGKSAVSLGMVIVIIVVKLIQILAKS